MISILALSLFTALSTVSALPTPAADPSFDDILSLSPRELLPAYLEERDVPNYPSPKPLKNLIAYFPKITSPSEGSEWSAGAPLTLAWNNTRPAYEENQIHKYATVYLGYRNAEDPSSGLNLDIERPLANLSLYDAPDPVQILLPSDLETRSTYLLVLGSTSNMSPQFTINAIESDESSSSESQSPATQAVVASPSSSSSSENDEEPLSTRVVAQSSSSSSTTARIAAKTQPADSTSSPQSVEQDSPSPSASAVSGTQANTPLAAVTSSSSSSSLATPIRASGALAASSQTPTSAASSQYTLSSLLVASLAVVVAFSI